MGLFDERIAYKPFEFPEYYTEGWLKQAQAFWLHTEIPMQSDFKDWNEKTGLNISVAVNVSVRQLDDSFVLRVQEILKQSELNSDFSLVINAVDKQNIKSYEYSSFKGKKSCEPEKNSCFASTNFYLNRGWNIKDAIDENTWQGVSRRNNLLRQLESNNYSVKDMMEILDVKLADGGAKLDYTIYQIIYDLASQDLFLKRNNEDKFWVHVELGKLFR